MENQPIFNQESFDKVVSEKGNEIYAMFEKAVNDQITDAVTQVTPEMKKALIKNLCMVHIKPFKDPLEQTKLEGLNGAALERIKLIKDFWEGVVNYLKNM